MPALSAHEQLAATAFAKGKATVQLLEAKLFAADPSTRRLAAIALGLRHPIYALKF